MVKQKGITEKSLSDVLVFFIVIIALIVTNITVNSVGTHTDTRKIGILWFDSDLNSKEAQRIIATLNDDVCDDCDDDDDDPTGGNKKPLAYIYSIEPNPAHEYDDINFEGYGEDADGTVIGYRWESDVDDLLSLNVSFISSTLKPGVHTITFFVQDDEFEWSEPVNASLQILENMAPLDPVIAGESRGKAGEQHEFRFITSDPEDHQVLYYVDWGDGTVSNWVGPYPSDEEIILLHIWDTKGTYSVRAKSKDVHNAESDWSIIEVQMPRSAHKWFIDGFEGRSFQRYPFLDRFLSFLLTD